MKTIFFLVCLQLMAIPIPMESSNAGEQTFVLPGLKDITGIMSKSMLKNEPSPLEYAILNGNLASITASLKQAPIALSGYELKKKHPELGAQIMTAFSGSNFFIGGKMKLTWKQWLQVVNLFKQDIRFISKKLDQVQGVDPKKLTAIRHRLLIRRGRQIVHLMELFALENGDGKNPTAVVRTKKQAFEALPSLLDFIEKGIAEDLDPNSILSGREFWNFEYPDSRMPQNFPSKVRMPLSNWKTYMKKLQNAKNAIKAKYSPLIAQSVENNGEVNQLLLQLQAEVSNSGSLIFKEIGDAYGLDMTTDKPLHLPPGVSEAEPFKLNHENQKLLDEMFGLLSKSEQTAAFAGHSVSSLI